MIVKEAFQEEKEIGKTEANNNNDNNIFREKKKKKKTDFDERGKKADL